MQMSLTKTSGHLSVPVGCGSVAARQGGRTLDLVSTEAVEVGLSSCMQAGHRNIPICRSVREVTTQHKRWREGKTNE